MVDATLRRYQIETRPTADYDADGRPLITWNFDHEGRRYLIEAFVDAIAMTSGKRLFEPYLSHELTNDQSYVEGFVARLDRFLSGGEWERPEE